MTRYYFDLHNGDGPTRDEHGIDLQSSKNIPRELARILLDVARHELTDGDHSVISVTVRDESGSPISVASLTFYQSVGWRRPFNLTQNRNFGSPTEPPQSKSLALRTTTKQTRCNH